MPDPSSRTPRPAPSPPSGQKRRRRGKRPSPPFYTGAVLVETTGHLILQRRDSIPWIKHPGKVATFGGGAEPGESIEACLFRELREEVELLVAATDCLPLLSLPETEDPAAPPAHYFAIKDIAPRNWVVREGALFRIHRDAALACPDLTPHTRAAIERLLSMED